MECPEIPPARFACRVRTLYVFPGSIISTPDHPCMGEPALSKMDCRKEYSVRIGVLHEMPGNSPSALRVPDQKYLRVSRFYPVHTGCFEWGRQGWDSEVWTGSRPVLSGGGRGGIQRSGRCPDLFSLRNPCAQASAQGKQVRIQVHHALKPLFWFPE